MSLRIIHTGGQSEICGLELSQTGLKSAIRDSRKLVERIADDTETVPHTSDTTEGK